MVVLWDDEPEDLPPPNPFGFLAGVLVGAAGVEPACPEATALKADVSTSSTTRPEKWHHCTLGLVDCVKFCGDYGCRG